MKSTVLYQVAGAVALAMCCGLAARAAPATTSPDEKTAYPAEVALSEEGVKGFVYRRFPGSQRLYVYDLDKGGHSACNYDCIGARPPVVAPATATPVGDWTVIKRDDGYRQWAYKGQPVYTFYHDPPGDPQGDGEGGVWHVLPYMPKL